MFGLTVKKRSIKNWVKKYPLTGRTLSLLFVPLMPLIACVVLFIENKEDIVNEMWFGVRIAIGKWED